MGASDDVEQKSIPWNGIDLLLYLFHIFYTCHKYPLSLSSALAGLHIVKRIAVMRAIRSLAPWMPSTQSEKMEAPGFCSIWFWGHMYRIVKIKCRTRFTEMPIIHNADKLHQFKKINISLLLAIAIIAGGRNGTQENCLTDRKKVNLRHLSHRSPRFISNKLWCWLFF